MSYTAGELLTAALLNGLLSRCTGYQSVSAGETTSSTSYTDLSTVGPSVTITSAGTLALVMYNCGAFSNSGTIVGHAMSFTVSGATTIAASDAYARTSTSTNAGFGFNVANFALVTINPGSNTYKAVYKCSAATSSTFNNRRLLVFAP